MAPNPRSRQPHLAVPRSRSSLLGITLEGLAPNLRSRFATLAEPRSHRCQQRSTTEGAPSSLPLTYASSRGQTLKDPVSLRTGPHVRGPSPDDRGWSAGLHGHLCGGRGDQVAKAPGTGPGWQQSRQNWAPTRWAALALDLFESHLPRACSPPEVSSSPRVRSLTVCFKGSKTQLILSILLISTGSTSCNHCLIEFVPGTLRPKLSFGEEGEAKWLAPCSQSLPPLTRPCMV